MQLAETFEFAHEIHRRRRRLGWFLRSVGDRRIQPITWRFLEASMDEAWAVLAPDILDDDSLSPDGFDLRQLRNDILALAA